MNRERPTFDPACPQDRQRRARREKITTAPRERPISNATARDRYDGAELRRSPGLTPGRFAAFDLPSRMGNRLYFPNGHMETLK